MNHLKTPLLGRGGIPCADSDPSRSTPCPQSAQSLAMVYSPVQEFEGLYSPQAGLAAGTIFCQLEKPFFGAGRL